MGTHHPHDHDHGHDHSHGHDHGDGHLGFALALTGSFMLVEAVGGWLTGSLALLADAGHMASDVGALGMALVASKIAARPPDARQTMGYQRAEVLAAALNGGALVVLSAWIAVEAVSRVADPHDIAGGPMAVIAGIGLLVNLVVAFRLHGHTDDLNSRAAYLHVLGDLLGSVGALLAGGLVWGFGWTLADPVISVVIAGILGFGAIRVLREVSAVLMQAVPDHVDLDGLERGIRAVGGVEDLHALHVWSLRPGEDVVSVHVVVCDGEDAAEVCAHVRDAIAGELPRAHITVQPEPVGAACGSSSAA